METSHTGRLLFPDGRLLPGRVVLRNGRIASVERVEQAAEPIIAPGWIDLQVNGMFGHDFTEQPESIAAAARLLSRTGVTAFLPTVITSPLEKYGQVVESYRTVVQPAMEQETGAARILGLHLEGPYLSRERRGAHNAAFLRSPADPLGDGLLGQTPRESPVRLVTLAPELDHALEAIRALRDLGVAVSLGHSAATFEQAEAGIEAGATYGTHLFNAMSPVQHRAPGLAGALLADDRASVGLIADGIHVHESILKWVVRAKGAGRVTLVTDAMAAAGLGPGAYPLGDRRVIVDATSARLEDGTLAGSILTMGRAVRNMVEWGCCSIEEALTMASTTPARVLGLDDIGRIAPGCRADLVVLDADLRVVQTYIEARPQL